MQVGGVRVGGGPAICRGRPRRGAALASAPHHTHTQTQTTATTMKFFERYGFGEDEGLSVPSRSPRSRAPHIVRRGECGGPNAPPPREEATSLRGLPDLHCGRADPSRPVTASRSTPGRSGRCRMDDLCGAARSAFDFQR